MKQQITEWNHVKYGAKWMTDDLKRWLPNLHKYDRWPWTWEMIILASQVLEEGDGCDGD